jgi:hypothetical protein
MLLQLKLHVVNFLELVEEPRIHRGHLRDLLDRVSLPQRVLHIGQPLGMRRHQPLRQNLGLDLVSAHALAGIERADALHQASLKVRPIAITSPTDFICTPRFSSAPGNFSNCHFGIFTTT